MSLNYRISSKYPPEHFEVGGIKLTTFREASCQIAVDCTNLAEIVAKNWWRMHMVGTPMKGPAYKDLVKSVTSAMALKELDKV